MCMHACICMEGTLTEDIFERNTHAQVTGSILQCMDEVDDIQEYLPGASVKMLFFRRLLMWLERFQGGDSTEGRPDIDVSHFFRSHSRTCAT